MSIMARIRTLPALLGAALLLGLTGCFSPIPPSEALRGLPPPPPPGTGELVFYRNLEYYGTQAMPTIYLNGQPAGISQNGAVSVRDVPPGTYEISVAPSLPYPYQFKTVTIGAGQVFYVNIDTLPEPGCRYGIINDSCYGNTFIVSIVSPQMGEAAIQGLRFLPG